MDALGFDFVNDGGNQCGRALVDFIEERRLNHLQSPGFEPFLETEAVAVNVACEIAVKGFGFKRAKPCLAILIPVYLVRVSVGDMSGGSVGRCRSAQRRRLSGRDLGSVGLWLGLVALVGLEEGLLPEKDGITHYSDELGGFVLVKKEDLVAGSCHRDVKSERFAPDFVTGNTGVRKGSGIGANDDDEAEFESFEFVDGADHNFVGVEDAVAGKGAGLAVFGASVEDVSNWEIVGSGGRDADGVWSGIFGAGAFENDFPGFLDLRIGLERDWWAGFALGELGVEDFNLLALAAGDLAEVVGNAAGGAKDLFAVAIVFPNWLMLGWAVIKRCIGVTEALDKDFLDGVPGDK